MLQSALLLKRLQGFKESMTVFKDLVYAISGQFPESDSFCQFTLPNELEITAIQRQTDDIDLHCFLVEVDSSNASALLTAIAAANFGLIGARGCTLGYLASSQQALLSYRIRYASKLSFEDIRSDAISFLSTSIDWRQRLQTIARGANSLDLPAGSFGFEQVASALV